MFLCIKQVNTVIRSRVKSKKHCNKRIEDKVGKYVYLLNLSHNYYKLTINVRYNT